MPMNDRNKKIIRIVLTVFLFPFCWIYYGIKIIEGFLTYAYSHSGTQPYPS